MREEILGEEDAGYDAETRFCLDWFQAFGMSDGKSGDAIGMANAYNLGLADLDRRASFYARGGVARLLKRSEMPDDWHPGTDKRLTHWECAQHLIRVLEAEGGGGEAAARLIAAMSPEDAEAARSLAYRLYDICEKKGWAQEAQAYNLLAEEFPHLEQAALEYEGRTRSGAGRIRILKGRRHDGFVWSKAAGGSGSGSAADRAFALCRREDEAAPRRITGGTSPAGRQAAVAGRARYLCSAENPP